MEPADIDWKNAESRYVRDEAFEHINAPKWVDLSDPDASPVNDEAWFCRPDCQHPKTAEDFKRRTPSPKVRLMRSSSEVLPLGERNGNHRDANNLKRRGIAPFLRCSPTREGAKLKGAAPKKCSEDLENQDPNLSTPPPPPARSPLGDPRASKIAKEQIKSSAEKKVDEEREELLQQKTQPRRLKSTLSARNLFSGKDVLSQISEFCHELKRIAVGSGRPAANSKEGANEDSKINDSSGLKGRKMTVRVEIENEKCRKSVDENSSSVLREVRAHPPTPQRIPSPSSRRLKNSKAPAATSSLLNKPPRSAAPKGILQELEQNKEERRQLLAAKDEDGNKGCSASDTEGGNSVGVFWFLKPCTYLVK